MADAWRPATKRAGLQGVTPHDLRHTCGSRLYANGLDVLTLSRLLGHSDVTVTMRVYVHELPGSGLPDMDALLGGSPRRDAGRDTAVPDTAGYDPAPLRPDPARTLKTG